MKRSVRTTVAISVLVLAVSACPLPLLAQDAPPVSSFSEFPMKKPRASAVVGTDEIVFFERDSRTEIQVSQILEVTYDNLNRRRSEQVGGSHGEGSLLFLIPALAMLPFKSTNHYVGIVWQDEEVRETIFQVGKGEYVDFLSRLKEVTGKDWRDLPAERERFRKAAVSAKLDNDVWIMGRIVAAGNYKLVLVPHDESADSGSGDLYVFAGAGRTQTRNRRCSQLTMPQRRTTGRIGRKSHTPGSTTMPPRDGVYTEFPTSVFRTSSSERPKQPITSTVLCQTERLLWTGIFQRSRRTAYESSAAWSTRVRRHSGFR